MTTPDDLTVLPDAVFIHGRHVNAVADQIAVAGQAGHAVRAGQDAYGQLCTIVPLMVNALQDLVLEAIDAAAGSLRDTTDRLAAAATGYQETDEVTADDLRRLEGGR
jgi:hypothetical protein